jgi:hypothetical protein
MTCIGGDNDDLGSGAENERLGGENHVNIQVER